MIMNKTISCPHCGRQYNVSSEWAGKQVMCKNCGNDFQIPLPPAKPIPPANPIPEPPSLLEDAVRGDVSLGDDSSLAFDPFAGIQDPLDQWMDSPLDGGQQKIVRPSNKIGLEYFLSRPLACLMALGILIVFCSLFLLPWSLQRLSALFDIGFGALIAYIGFRADRGKTIENQICNLWILIYLFRALFIIGIIALTAWAAEPNEAVQKLGPFLAFLFPSLLVVVLTVVILLLMRWLFGKFGFFRPAGIWFLLVSPGSVILGLITGLIIGASTAPGDLTEKSAGSGASDPVDESEWVPFESVEGNYRILFPVDPQKGKNVPTNPFTNLFSVRTPQMQLCVGYAEREVFQATNDDELFHDLLGDLNGRIVKQKKFTLAQMHPAVDLVLKAEVNGQSLLLRFRYLLVGKRVYEMNVCATNMQQLNTLADTFFPSFEILDPNHESLTVEKEPQKPEKEREQTPKKKNQTGVPAPGPFHFPSPPSPPSHGMRRRGPVPSPGRMRGFPGPPRSPEFQTGEEGPVSSFWGTPEKRNDSSPSKGSNRAKSPRRMVPGRPQNQKLSSHTIQELVDQLETGHEIQNKEIFTELANRKPVQADREAVCRAILRAMKSTFPLSKLAAADAAVVWGSPKFMNDFAEAVRNSTQLYDKPFVERMAQIPDEKIAEAVVEVWKTNPFFFNETLNRLGSRAEKPLWQSLSDRNPQVQVDVCQKLAKLGTPKSIPKLKKLLRGKRPQVSQAAKEAIEHLEKISDTNFQDDMN